MSAVAAVASVACAAGPAAAPADSTTEPLPTIAVGGPLPLVRAEAPRPVPPPPPGTAGPTSPTPSAPAATEPVPTVADPGTVVTMVFTGDILPHSPLWRGAARHAAAAGRDGYDFEPMLAGLRPLLDGADLAVCHLETPIVPAGEELSTMPYYGVPPEVVDAIAAVGYDRCSTASNHTFDRGVPGIERTVGEFARVGVAQDGMGRHPADLDPRPFDVNGIAVAHLAYTYGYNGIRPPAGEEWRSRLIDPARVVADAAAARRAGAELVVVSLHWGVEGRHEPSDEQRWIAEQLTASGQIDLIVGHHAHVVQPIEQINGVWVLFGLGNSLSNMPTGWYPPATQDGIAVMIAVHRDAHGVFRWLRPVAVPTWVDRHDGWRITLVADALADDGLGAGRTSVLAASLARTAAVVGDFLAG